MLAICCLCATLSKEDLLTALSDKGHSIIHQLKHCFKFEIETSPQRKNYVCAECIKTLQICDDFYKKIQRAQESLRILYKAKSQSNAEKSAKKVIGTIRTRDFCKIQNWSNDESNVKEPTVESLKLNAVDPNKSKTNVPPIEEYSCNDQANAENAEIKVECEDTNAIDPLETKSNEQTVDHSMVFENFLRNVLSEKKHTEEENIDNAELSTSEEANFTGFDQTLEDEEYFIEEHLEDETLDEDDMNDHLKVSVIKYQCETCSKDFPNEEMLQKHLSCHNQERTFKCNECPKVFHHPSSLYYHAQTHLQANSKDGEFKCGYCAKTFNHVTILKMHMRTHSAEKSPQCKICKKFFRDATSLWHHMKGHTNDRGFQCQHCPKVFFKRENLEAHLLVHQNRPLFTCDICEKSYYSQRNLIKHMSEQHAKKPMDTPLAIGSATQTDAPISQDRGSKLVSPTAATKQVQIDEQHTKRIWKCRKCPDIFSTITHFNNHLRWHRENQYTCEYCFKEFRSAIWYKTHLRTHTLREQFKCKTCSATFLNQRSLTAHTCSDKVAE